MDVQLSRLVDARNDTQWILRATQNAEVLRGGQSTIRSYAEAASRLAVASLFAARRATPRLRVQEP